MDEPEFQLPKGYQLPEGANEKGDEFDAVVKLRLYGDGKVCLVSLDGTPLKGRDKDEAAEEDPGFRDSVMSGLGQE